MPDEFAGLVDGFIGANQSTATRFRLEQLPADQSCLFKVLHILRIFGEPIVMSIAVDSRRSAGGCDRAGNLELLKKGDLVRGRQCPGDGLHGDASSWFYLHGFGLWSGC